MLWPALSLSLERIATVGLLTDLTGQPVPLLFVLRIPSSIVNSQRTVLCVTHLEHPKDSCLSRGLEVTKCLTRAGQLGKYEQGD